MTPRKKKREFSNYAEAFARSEELAASGDRESDDYLDALEAAGFFLIAESQETVVVDAEPKRRPKNMSQKKGLRKWFTIKDLMQNIIDDKVKTQDKYTLL